MHICHICNVLGGGGGIGVIARFTSNWGVRAPQPQSQPLLDEDLGTNSANQACDHVPPLATIAYTFNCLLPILDNHFAAAL